MATNFTKAERRVIDAVKHARNTSNCVTLQGKLGDAVARVPGCSFEQFVFNGVEFSHDDNYYKLVGEHCERIA